MHCIRHFDTITPYIMPRPTLVVRRHPDLLRGIYALGFNKPSKIQERALPLLLANPCVVTLQVKYLIYGLLIPHLLQPSKHDWTIPIRHRQDCRLRSHDAITNRLFHPVTTSHLYSTDSRTGIPDYASRRKDGPVHARHKVLCGKGSTV